MSEYDDWIRSAGCSFVGSYHAAKNRANVEQRKVVARHPCDEYALRLASDSRKTEESDAVAGNILEDVNRGGAVVLEIRERNAPQSSAGGLLACDHNEPVAVPDRQGPEDDRVHDTEHSGIDSDAQGKRDDGRECKRAVPAKHSPAVANVLQELCGQSEGPILEHRILI